MYYIQTTVSPSPTPPCTRTIPAPYQILCSFFKKKRKKGKDRKRERTKEKERKERKREREGKQQSVMPEEAHPLRARDKTTFLLEYHTESQNSVRA